MQKKTQLKNRHLAILIGTYLILLILHSCNQETLPTIKVNSKEKTVQVISEEYYIDSLELTNYFQKNLSAQSSQ